MVIAAERAVNGEVGSLRLGFISSIAYEYLPPILRAFRHKFPDVCIELHEFQVMQRFGMLLDGHIDVAVLRPLYKGSRILTRTIVTS